MGKQKSFPNAGWEISDFLVGLTIGAYGPVMQMARDDDCFSSWYAWGTVAIEFSIYFDRHFDTESWLDLDIFFIIILFFVYQSVVLPGKCIDELNNAKETKWFENFGFLADIEAPKVPRSKREYSRDSISFTVFK